MPFLLFIQKGTIARGIGDSGLR